MAKILRVALAAGILGLLGNSSRADEPAAAVAADPVTTTASDSVAANPGDWRMCDYGCDDPLWSVTGGAVFMTRSTPTSQQIIHPVGSTTTVSNAADFNFNYSGGPQVTIDRRIGDGNILELRYFGDLDWTSSANYGAVGNVQIGSFSNFGAIGLTANDATRLNSAEFNWLHSVSDRVTFLAGARWLDVHDELQYHIAFPAFGALYDWKESNRLYGGQLGGKFALWKMDGPLSIDAVLKAGVFANSADNNFDLLPTTGGSFPGGATGTATSFVGEIDVMATYAVCSHISLQGGYQLLWIDRLALGTEEAAAATLNGTQDAISATGRIFASGATAGIVLTW